MAASTFAACAPSRSSIEPGGRIIGVSVDQTGSVTAREFARYIGFIERTIVPELTSGDIFIIGAITAHSSQAEAVIREFPTTDLYYDPRHEARLDSLRQEIVHVLRQLKPGQDQRTDIVGLLAKTSRLMACRDSTWTKYLFVFSDLEDNVRGRPNGSMPDLTGVRVYVIGASHEPGPNDIEAYAEKVAAWQTACHDYGYTANTFIWDWNEAEMNVGRIRESLRQELSDQF